MNKSVSEKTRLTILRDWWQYVGMLVSGTFDFVRGFVEFFLLKKLKSPFIFLGSTYMYEDYQAMKY